MSKCRYWMATPPTFTAATTAGTVCAAQNVALACSAIAALTRVVNAARTIPSRHTSESTPAAWACAVNACS